MQIHPNYNWEGSGNSRMSALVSRTITAMIMMVVIVALSLLSTVIMEVSAWTSLIAIVPLSFLNWRGVYKNLPKT